MLLVLCMMLTVAPISALAVLPSYIWDVLKESDTLQVQTAVDNPFTDVSSADAYFDDVMYVRANGFFTGTTTTTFDPDGTMTRGMFVTVLGRMAGVDAAGYAGVSDFSDVSADQYYAPYVAWAAKHGITTGTGGGKFSPDALIDRQQAATFLVRYFEAFDVVYFSNAAGASEPADIADAEDWARDAVSKLWRSGIMTGDGSYADPDAKATRAWMAGICRRADINVKAWYKEPGVFSDRVSVDPSVVGADIILDGVPADPSGINSDFVLELTPEKEPEPQIDPYKGVIMNPVSFYDDEGNLIDTLYAIDNLPLAGLPSVEKSSKENAILVGYYLDPEYTQPFYAGDPVKQTTKVYAKYEKIEKQETYNFTSFARENLPTDVKYSIRWVGAGTPSEAEVKKAASIETKDGTDPVEIKITGSGKDYVVAPVDKYNEGSIYELTLADGWIFVEDGEEMADTIRTATLSIYMAPVDNLRMNTGIKYLKDTGDIEYSVDGDTFGELDTEALKGLVNGTGSFKFVEADEQIVSNDAEEVDNDIDTLEELMELKEGDVLCIYVGKKPTDRDANDGAELLNPVTYVKVAADVTDDTVTFAAMGEADQKKLYEIADNFPFLVDAVPTDNTINISELDVPTYEIIIGETELDVQDTIDKAIPKINEGDFVTIYTSLYTGGKENPTEEELGYTYGEITGYENGVITYKTVSRQYILDSMNLYADVDYSGDMLIDEPQLYEMKKTISRQLEESRFPQEAAEYLAEMVIVDNGYGGADFELEDLRWDFDIITDKKQLRIGDGVQLSISVDVKVNISTADGGNVVIDLSASFLQEVSVDPKVKGEIVYKEIVFVPVPVGVHVGADIDVKSFTDFDFAAEVYTVSNDESAWEDIEELISDPEVDDLLDQVAQLQRLIDGGIASASEQRAYESEIDDLWSQITDITRVTRSKWNRLCEAMNRTSVASDLLSVADVAEESGISRDYEKSLQALMEKYQEVIERDTDWVNLVEKEMFSKEVFVYGFAIGVEVDFVVGADMSIAIGSGLEYQVGKRYSFWFEIGLFKPTGGSSTTDLLDESFQFQFYVMGRLGLRAGVKAKFYVAVGTGDLASVGIAAELGPYLKLYGFYVYENNKYRPKGSDKWTTSERMIGAVFTEFGLYLIVSFEAEALSLFEYSYDFVNEEFPLLYGGNRRYYYDFAYQPESGEQVVIYDEDRNSDNGISMAIPSSVLALSYIDLDTGRMGSESLDYNNYYYSVSNPDFSVDTSKGKILVNVPEGTRFVECDLTVTYKHGKMAFSNYDMSVTVPLVWTNLSNLELKEYFTAEVRVGNLLDGYETVWRKRLLKRQPFDLPTEDEVKELIGWDDAVYDFEKSPGYGNIQTEDLLIIEDLTYEFDVTYKRYAVTVTGLEGVTDENGNPITEKTYYAKYGEAFDFSDLEDSGTNDVNSYYSKFTEVTTDATVVINGEEQVVDLTKPINRTMAEAMENGITAKANYVDVTTSAVFTFAGIPNSHEDVTFKIRKGTTISTEQYEYIEDIVKSELNMEIRTVTPNVNVPINNSTNYIVDCGKLTGERYTINFVENYSDGTVETTATPESEKGYASDFVFDLTNIVKLENGYIGPLYKPTRIGYTFGGWFTDQDTFEDEFLTQKMPKGGATVYAKWIPNEYEISFNEFGGVWPKGYSKVMLYDSFYGQNFEENYVLTYVDGQVDYSLFERTELPKARWTGQYRFDGWWTEPKMLPKYEDAYYQETGFTFIDRPAGFEDVVFGDGGTRVIKDTQVKVTKDTTIWAHWKMLVQIPDSVVEEVFDFTFYDVPYDGDGHKADYTMDDDVTFTHNGETFTCPTDFKVEYKTNVAGGRYEDEPKNADVYLARLTRPACDDFRKVDIAIDHVFEITKIASSVDSDPSVKSAYYANVIPNAPSSYVGDGAFEYAVTTTPDSAPAANSSKWSQGVAYNVCDGNTAGSNTTLYLWVRLAEGRNYLQSDPAGGVAFKLSDYTGGAAAKSLISNEGGYSYKLTIHTPDETDAGTNADVFAKFGGGNKQHLDLDGNDFEKGDTDIYNVAIGGDLPNAMGTIPTTIEFEYETWQGWTLGWLRLDVYKDGAEVFKGVKCEEKTRFSESKPVTFNLTGYARKVDSAAYQLTALSDEYLTSSSNGSISASINSTLYDSTWKRTYNFYEYKNAPKLVAYFSNSWFDKYIVWTGVDSFVIDEAALYAAMDEYAIQSVELIYGVKYSPVDGDYSMVEEDRTFTRKMTIRTDID